VYTKPVSISIQGTTTIGYYSVDKSGNAETALSALVLIDKTPPTLSIGTNAKATYTGTATITATAADTLSGVNSIAMKLDNGTWTTVSSLAVTAPGKHTVYARAYDNAGNWRIVDKVIAVYGAPTLSIQASSTSTGTIAASGTISPKQKTNLTLVIEQSRAGGKWGPEVKYTVSTGSGGTWGSDGRLKRLSGTYRVQAQSAAHGYYKAAASPWVSVTAR
jgi:hypothetical protein